MQLKDSNGNIIQPLSTTSGASDTETTLIYDSSNWVEGESFTLRLIPNIHQH